MNRAASSRSLRTGAVALAILATCACSDRSPRQDAAVDARMPAVSDIFAESSAQTGLDFRYFIGATGDYLMPESMHAGGALLDYDGDGDLDIYLVQGSMLDPTKSISDTKFQRPSDSPPKNRLFRNNLIETGALGFTDVTEEAGVGHTGYGAGAAAGDFDNDGDVDLYVTNFGSNTLYENQGDGRFTDITARAGADDERWSTSAAFVDYDRDGDLDLMVTNYLAFTLEDHQPCSNPFGIVDYCGPKTYEPVADRLLRNEGEGRFVDATAQAGIDQAFGAGLGVTAADFNDDGWPDLYVANDGHANQLWINRGDGRFENDALLAGAAFNSDGMAEASMGVTAGDFDGDGDDDLFMSHLNGETNTLYRNEGAAQFVDATDQVALGNASRSFTGFGTAWLDYDNDGQLDLFIANGAVIAQSEQAGVEPYPYLQKNQLFHHGQNGKFSEVTDAAGPAMALQASSRGAAFGDVDNDGDVDVVVFNNNGPAHLLMNQVGNERNWLGVRLRGVTSNREGAGTRVAVLRSNERALWRRAHRDGSYTSASDIRVHFGLGESDAPVDVVARWPSGRHEVWRSVAAGRFVTLEEGTGEPWTSPVAVSAAKTNHRK